MPTRQRVFTYITYRRKLLVFDHVEHPELSMQIPGGTIEADETPANAALREAGEETGLGGLKLVRFLGEFEKDLISIGRAEIIHAWFFHLEAASEPPLRWRHSEDDPHGTTGSIEFELYWLPLDSKPDFGGIDGALYPQLLESVRLSGF